MALPAPQNFANHGRIDPWFHFFLLSIFFVNLIGAIVMAVRHASIHTAWMVVLSIGILVLIFEVRVYSLKVQTRVIRLEERLRLATLLKDPLRSRIGELTESQLVGLRFASDAEVPALVEATLAGNLTNKQIKQQVKDWRADHLRV